MEHEQLFIAPKIKVGFQNRNDTYTEKLAYVIYYDLKGVLRKETSWESWRDKKIEPVEFDNVPTEGFVLNKKVGGGRSDWNVRQEYVRVYDPRNFEFEITVPNLLFILRECDCSKGKGLEGKFVYAWSGTTLILLPATSEEYTRSAGYTNLQNKTILAKDLVKGASYLTKKQNKWIYIDRRLVHNNEHVYWYKKGKIPVQLEHVFWSEYEKQFIFQKDMKRLAAVISDNVASNYAELVEMYDKSKYGSAPVRLFVKEQPAMVHNENTYWYPYSWAREGNDGVFYQYKTKYTSAREVDYVQRTYRVSLEDVNLPAYPGLKKLAMQSDYATVAAPGSRRYASEMPYVETLNQGLWVELASGSQFKLLRGSLIEPENGAEDGED